VPNQEKLQLQMQEGILLESHEAILRASKTVSVFQYNIHEF